MSSLVVLAGFLSVVVGQSFVDIAAKALTPNAVADATGYGFGQSVVGNVIAIADDNLAYSSSVVVAQGGKGKDKDDKPKPKPPKVPSKPKPNPKPYPYPYPSHQKAYPYPVPKKHYDEPKCGDLYDDKCYYIDEYDYCGYCIDEKYPLKGYGCKYTEEKVKKSSGSKKMYDDYEVKIVPLCECKGDFILKGEYCPSCDLLLVELLKCAGIKDPKKSALEIPEKCLKAVGVTVDYLVKCEFVKPSSSSKKVKEDPKVVLVVPEKKKKEDPKTHYKSLSVAAASAIVLVPITVFFEILSRIFFQGVLQ
eukprot:TRINITY_DN68_c0_g1_i2.p2 TRINITY_DN68_c0_g1~~TRINITY_DN68_c0_g1_i2.p2  ORF type:complete len:306 (-),score=52.49 TRINITY_DN68_c0_g1_i2:356-1273(-)